jgi:mercuric ion transport protein
VIECIGYDSGMDRSHQKPIAGLLAAFGLATGAGAVLAASCCVLPLVLGGLGAGAGLFSILEFLTDYQTPILLFSAGLIAIAWVVYFHRRGARSTAVALAASTLLVLMAANWGVLERPLLKIVRASR